MALDEVMMVAADTLFSDYANLSSNKENCSLLNYNKPSTAPIKVFSATPWCRSENWSCLWHED